MISRSDGDGAGRAALRLLNTLQDMSIDTRLIVGRKTTADGSVTPVAGRFSDPWSIILNQADRLSLAFNKRGRWRRTAAWIPNRLARRSIRNEADVVNLHWVGGGMLSVRDIARIRQPIVWTMHDMWGFTGVDHYVPTEVDRGWRFGYDWRNSTPAERWVWSRKERLWTRPMHIVAPSRWLATEARESILMHDWPIRVIPNPVPTDVFAPQDKAQARDMFQLPSDNSIVLFGAVGAVDDDRKGWDLLVQALGQLSTRLTEVRLVVFGSSNSGPERISGLRVHWVGTITDDKRLAALYNAADVMVVPSRLDNLPQTGVEAQACGCPVVAFDTGGLSDVVEHEETGFLARAFDTEELAGGISWILENKQRATLLGLAARERAVRNWKPSVVGSMYMELFETVARGS